MNWSQYRDTNIVNNSEDDDDNGHSDCSDNNEDDDSSISNDESEDSSSTSLSSSSSTHSSDKSSSDGNSIDSVIADEYICNGAKKIKNKKQQQRRFKTYVSTIPIQKLKYTCWDEQIHAIRTNKFHDNYFHVCNITSIQKLYELGCALETNRQITHIIFSINELEQILFYDTSTFEYYYDEIITVDKHISEIETATTNNHSSSDDEIYICKNLLNTNRINTILQPFGNFICRNKNLQKITLQNGSGKTITTCQIVSWFLLHTLYKKSSSSSSTRTSSVHTLRLFCLEIPLVPLATIISNKDCTIKHLEIDLCTIITSSSSSLTSSDSDQIGTSTGSSFQHNGKSNNDQELDNEDDESFHDNDNFNNIHNMMIYNDPNYAAEYLGTAFQNNISLHSLLLYRLDELYVNSIIVQLRSHTKLCKLSLSMPGFIVLGLETSITNIPSIQWCNNISYILLSPIVVSKSNNNKNLHTLQFHSIKFNDLLFHTLCTGIISCTTLYKLAFEFCNYSFTNTKLIQNDLSSVFLSSSTSTSVTGYEKKSTITELIIRQTTYHTNNNLLLSTIPVLLQYENCTIRSLHITSINEHDFTILFNSLLTNKQLQYLYYEYNTVENESMTDKIRCTTLIQCIPQLQSLQYLTIGVGLGITQYMSNQLLQSLFLNKSLYSINISYLGAHPFFPITRGSTRTDSRSIDDVSHRQTTDTAAVNDHTNSKHPSTASSLSSSSSSSILQMKNPLSYIQKRNRFLPKLLGHIQTSSYNNSMRWVSNNNNTYIDEHNNDYCTKKRRNKWIVPLSLTSRLLSCALEWDDGISIVFRTILVLQLS